MNNSPVPQILSGSGPFFCVPYGKFSLFNRWCLGWVVGGWATSLFEAKFFLPAWWTRRSADSQSAWTLKPNGSRAPLFGPRSSAPGIAVVQAVTLLRPSRSRATLRSRMLHCIKGFGEWVWKLKEASTAVACRPRFSAR